MSTIPTANLFLGRDFTPVDSSVLDRLIREVCDEAEGTRKGRHWDAYDHATDTGITIHVYRTAKHLPHCEEQLLTLAVAPEDVPECIAIVGSRGGEDALAVCARLTDLICAELGCSTLGAELVS